MGEACPEFKELLERHKNASISLAVLIGKSRNKELEHAFTEYMVVLGLMIDHLDSHARRN